MPDDELLDADEHGEAQAVGVPVELVGEMAVRDDPTESYCEVTLKLEKKPSLDLVRGVGREGISGQDISSRGKTVCGGARVDGCRVALRAGRVVVGWAGGIGSGPGGFGGCHCGCDGGGWEVVERVVARWVEGEHVGAECGVALGGLEVGEGVGIE